jgi:hypothetical protein
VDLIVYLVAPVTVLLITLSLLAFVPRLAVVLATDHDAAVRSLLAHNGLLLWWYLVVLALIPLIGYVHWRAAHRAGPDVTISRALLYALLSGWSPPWPTSSTRDHPPSRSPRRRSGADRPRAARSDGRLFFVPAYGNKPVSRWSYAAAWRAARKAALTPSQQKSPLAARPYDLRHAAVSRWPNAGVSAPRVAEWARHSVHVLLKVSAKCIDGQEDAARRRCAWSPRAGRGYERTELRRSLAAGSEISWFPMRVGESPR